MKRSWWLMPLISVFCYGLGRLKYRPATIIEIPRTGKSVDHEYTFVVMSWAS